MRNAITDVPGIRVGHAQRTDDGWLTGVTVVVPPAEGAVGGVDVRGGGPGTRETDLLAPENVVERVHAVVLTGGSALGLAAADGVTRALLEEGVGFAVGTEPGEGDGGESDKTSAVDHAGTIACRSSACCAIFREKAAPLARLRRGYTHRGLERRAAGVALPQVAHATPLETFGPLGNVDTLPALRALNHRT